MKTLPQSELKKRAQDVFDFHPNEKKVLATADGNIFLESKKNAAELHARLNGGLTIHEFSRSEDNGEAEAKETGIKNDIVQSNFATGLPTVDQEEITPEGVDWLFDEAVKAEIISLKKGWYKYQDATVGQGAEKAKEKLLQDKELRMKVAREVIAKLSNN